MMAELSIPNTACRRRVALPRHVTGFVLDAQDAALEESVAALGLDTVVTQTVMLTLDRPRATRQRRIAVHPTNWSKKPREGNAVWAVVPLKNIRHAKQRLAPLLTPAERSQLMLAMVSDVLIALTRTRGLAGILLVSRAPEATDLAREHGCELYSEAPGADLSESVQAAGGYLVANRDATERSSCPVTCR